jgi:diguanylate cyclase (GGDEF)-like protein
MLEREIVALIYVYKTDPAARPFDQNDIHLAVAISHQAALTIQRARLLDKARVLEEWAMTDSLTGLHNRRQILMLAELEFQRTRRYRNRHPMSTLLVDVDYFKRVNDTQGHAVGDQVLHAVATRCRLGLREIDMMGRYGGDEFVILLIETDAAGAQRVAERLRRSVAEAPIDTAQGSLSVTISVGVAVATESCPNWPELLNMADRALYSGKEAGRNRVEICNEIGCMVPPLTADPVAQPPGANLLRSRLAGAVVAVESPTAVTQ